MRARPPVVLLGAQRFDPNVARVAAELDIAGPFAAITAGWREREDEDDEFAAHFAAHGAPIVNLALYRRSEDVFKRDPEFHAAHRARQVRLIQRQDFYRIRLTSELRTVRVIGARQASPEALTEEEATSVAALATLDRTHLARCQATRDAFDARWDPLQRPAIAEHRAELLALLADCGGVAIAGGHVATLLNRFDLFGLRDALAKLPVLAWSAGAMAVCERVVLFHDSPPQGAGASQVLDRGLGLARSVVALPNPHTRLRLDDPTRVRMLARRFAPALPIGLPGRAWVRVDDGAVTAGHGAFVLDGGGDVATLPHVAAA